MTDSMEKKKSQLRAIFEKMKILPETELDYAAGFIDGMSAAYNRAVILPEPPQKTA